MSAPAMSSNSRQAVYIVSVVIVSIGLMVFVAKRRMNATDNDKAVASQLRQLSGAADQYFFENGGSVVAASQIIGPERYVKVLQIHDGETYPVNFTKNITLTATGVAGARTITYAP